MKFIDIIGLFGSLCIGFSLIPQTYKSIKDNNVNNLSIFYILLTLLACVSMGIYSIYYFILPMIIANTSVFINCIILFFLIVKNKYCSNNILNENSA